MTPWSPVIERLELDEAHLKAHWSLPKQDARFLYLLARIGRFKHMLEIGTSIGYSTLHLALAASRQAGRVISLDASRERQAQAALHLQEAALSEYVTLLTGDALSLLAELVKDAHRFDLAFLDARKSEYAAYLEAVETLLMPGGVLIADNTRSHRQQMQGFIDQISASSYWEVSDLETPNGFVVAYYLGKA